MNSREFGNLGEKIARKYLEKNGYNTIITNYYSRFGEIDIISQKEKLIVFVEVKTRTNIKYGMPSDSITKIKKIHMKQTAKEFISENKLYKYDIRFDAIEIFICNGNIKINQYQDII